MGKTSSGSGLLVLGGMCVGFVGGFLVPNYLGVPVPSSIHGTPSERQARVSTPTTPSRREVVSQMLAREDAADRALLAAEQQRKGALEAETQKRRDEEERLHNVASVKKALAIARGEIVDDTKEPAWIAEVRRGPKTPYEQACEAYARYRSASWVDYALTVRSPTSKVEPKEVGFDSVEEFRKFYRAVAQETVPGFLFALKNRPEKDVTCGSGEGAVALRDGPEVVGTILYVLRQVELTPEYAGTTPGELREFLRGAVRAQVEELRPLLGDSHDARAIVAGYLEDYNFTREEIGLSADEATLLNQDTQK